MEAALSASDCCLFGARLCARHLVILIPISLQAGTTGTAYAGFPYVLTPPSKYQNHILSDCVIFWSLIVIGILYKRRDINTVPASTPSLLMLVPVITPEYVLRRH